MSQPGATNPRKRREAPTRQLPACWISEDLWTRLAAHVQARGLVRSKFIERAIATQLRLEAGTTPAADS